MLIALVLRFPYYINIYPKTTATIYNKLVINTVAIILIIFNIGQILLGLATLAGKFDPLLSKERKKLPAKVRKKARLLNAISMIATSTILCLLGVGMLTRLDVIINISAFAMVSFIVIMMPISIKTEAKYFK